MLGLTPSEVRDSGKPESLPATTKREREITNSGGGGKRHKPFGTGSHGNGKK